MVLDRGDLGGGVENLFAVLGDELHVGSDLCDSVNVAERIAEVEVLVAVAVVCPVDEFAGESEPFELVGRLHPLVIVLSEDCLLELAVRSPVHVQSHVPLCPVQNLHEDVPAVRRPGNVGQILVISEIVGLEIDCGIFGKIIDADADILGIHTSHRVLQVHERACTGGDVQKRKICNSGLVFPVECEASAVRSPENAAVDAEFVSAGGVSVCDV